MPYAASVIKGIIDTNYVIGNADSITPRTEAVVTTSVREVDAREKDWILTYNMPASERKFAINYQFVFRNDPVSVDIRIGKAVTASDVAQDILDHAVKVRDEVRRSLYLSRNAPGSGYDELRYRRQQDLSDRMRRLFRWVDEWELIEYASALP